MHAQLMFGKLDSLSCSDTNQIETISDRKKGKEPKRSRGGESYDDDQQFNQGEQRSEKKRRKYAEDDQSPARCKLLLYFLLFSMLNLFLRRRIKCVLLWLY